LLDRNDKSPILCSDWHKENVLNFIKYIQDWLIAVGNSNKKISIWDVRNTINPLKTRKAHELSVNKVKFDTNNPNHLMSCSNDNTVRIWDTENGILLINEHKYHESKVTSIDWNIFNSNIITSGEKNSSLICINVIIFLKSKERKHYYC
jgi:WD40 repeat protein